MEQPDIKGVTIKKENEIVYIKFDGNDEKEKPFAVQGEKEWITGDNNNNNEGVLYYEVAIKSSSDVVALGLAEKEFPKTGVFPGHIPGSFGYHGDDGNRFIGRQQKGGWPTFGTGDVVGIGLKCSTGEIFGTLNGKLLGLITTKKEKAELYPTIAIVNPSELEIKFYSHFSFDLNSLPDSIVPFFGELEKTDITASKILVLFINGLEEGEQEKLKKELELASVDAKKVYSYQSFYTSQNDKIAQNVRKLTGIDRSPLLVALDLEADKRYAHPQSDPITTSSILSFLSSLSLSLISPLRRSAPRPFNDSSPSFPSLSLVVSDSFDEIVINNEKDVLLDVYADWCGPCKLIAPTIALLSEVFSDNDNIVIAKIDCDENDIDRTYLPETSIPNIKLFRGVDKKAPIKYQGNRSLINFIEFIHQHASVPFDLEATKQKAKKLQEESEKKALKNVISMHSDTEFNSHIKSNKLVIVDYFATWCGPCKFIAPFYANLSEEYTDVVFLKVDVDLLADVSAAQGISCMPTFKAYKNGIEIDKLEGADQDKLKALVTKNL